MYFSTHAQYAGAYLLLGTVCELSRKLLNTYRLQLIACAKSFTELHKIRAEQLIAFVQITFFLLRNTRALPTAMVNVFCCTGKSNRTEVEQNRHDEENPASAFHGRRLRTNTRLLHEDLCPVMAKRERAVMMEFQKRRTIAANPAPAG